MKNYLLSGLLILSTGFVVADGHMSAEKEVLKSLAVYFEARNAEDWNTVVSYESKSGTYGTNSDGSFHKSVVMQSAEDWANSGQGGSLNIHYPEAIQLSDCLLYTSPSPRD